MAWAGDELGRDCVAVDVAVVVQHAGGRIDSERLVLGCGVAVGGGDRRIVDGRDRQVHCDRGGGVGAVERAVRERVGAVVVGSGAVAERAVGVQREAGGVGRTGHESGREGVAGVRVGVVVEHAAGGCDEQRLVFGGVVRLGRGGWGGVGVNRRDRHGELRSLAGRHVGRGRGDLVAGVDSRQPWCGEAEPAAAVRRAAQAGKEGRRPAGANVQIDADAGIGSRLQSERDLGAVVVRADRVDRRMVLQAVDAGVGVAGVVRVEPDRGVRIAGIDKVDERAAERDVRVLLDDDAGRAVGAVGGDADGVAGDGQEGVAGRERRAADEHIGCGAMDEDAVAAWSGAARPGGVGEDRVAGDGDGRGSVADRDRVAAARSERVALAGCVAADREVGGVHDNDRLVGHDERAADEADVVAVHGDPIAAVDADAAGAAAGDAVADAGGSELGVARADEQDGVAVVGA